MNRYEKAEVNLPQPFFRLKGRFDMKQQKRRFAVLIAALMLGTFCTGCGSEENGGGSATTAATAAAGTTASATGTGTAAADTTAAASGTTGTAASGTTGAVSGTAAETGTNTTANAENTKSAETTEAPSGGESKETTTESGNDKPSDGGSEDTPSGGEEKPAATTAKPADDPQPATTAKTQAAVTDEDDDENKDEVIKNIYLQETTAKYAGEGIYVDGSKIMISAGGSYQITGKLTDGQIVVNTDKKKVKLLLDNASITNKSGAAISCLNAKKMTVKTLPDTVNYLEDGGTHDEDKGVIFSEDTVQLGGDGTLNIKANYAHGVQSDDDIRVTGGKINITAAKSCLHSNDGIEIKGGELYCDGGTNGIKTDGYITIMGGRSVFMGGEREEKGAIYCDGVFSVTDGEFWAIGNTFTKPDAALTTANVLGIVFTQSQPGGTCVNVTRGSNEVFTMTSPRQFKYVVYSGPNTLKNAEYKVSYGGTVSGDKSKANCTGKGYSGGTDGGSFTAGEAITFYTVS